jgi:dTDP-glucose pyrophosphorylase
MKDFYDNNVSKDSFSRIKNMYLTDIIQYLITDKDLLITVQKIRRGWCEIDTSEDYNYAQKFFENNYNKIIDDNIS